MMIKWCYFFFVESVLGRVGWPSLRVTPNIQFYLFKQKYSSRKCLKNNLANIQARSHTTVTTFSCIRFNLNPFLRLGMRRIRLLKLGSQLRAWKLCIHTVIKSSSNTPYVQNDFEIKNRTVWRSFLLSLLQFAKLFLFHPLDFGCVFYLKRYEECYYSACIQYLSWK